LIKRAHLNRFDFSPFFHKLDKSVASSFIAKEKVGKVLHKHSCQASVKGAFCDAEPGNTTN
jgi:hypothetical protein